MHGLAYSRLARVSAGTLLGVLASLAGLSGRLAFPQQELGPAAPLYADSFLSNPNFSYGSNSERYLPAPCTRCARQSLSRPGDSSAPLSDYPSARLYRSAPLPPPIWDAAYDRDHSAESREYPDPTFNSLQGPFVDAGLIGSESHEGADREREHEASETSNASGTTVSRSIEAPPSDTKKAEAPKSSPPVCDEKKRKELAQKVASSHKGVFFENDFRYLEDPCYTDWHFGDLLKRHYILSGVVLDIGGQYRLRQHSEQNMRGLGLTGIDDDFLLQRFRLYGDVKAGDWFRFYAEFLDAQSNFEDFAPRAIEENRADMLNLFGDVRLWAGCRGELWARIGRQELLYGAQRFISPLDWANTRRNFEGYKLYWKGEAWNVDAFWVRPVVVDRERFDSPDQSQEFMGIYASTKHIKPHTIDLYYLRYLETDDRPLAVNFEFDTLGARWLGEWDIWLAELEAAVQWGEYDRQDHLAGMYTAGLGRKFPQLAWEPIVWVYYDWASGDETPGNGFHHLFPLGHRYLGWMDLFGRRNIQDVNLLLTLQPHKNLKLFLWHHILFLEDTDDVPYGVTMRPLASAPGGDRYLGQELDLALDWSITPRTNMLWGYSHFFAGDFFETNPTVPYSDDADFFYTQFTVNF